MHLQVWTENILKAKLFKNYYVTLNMIFLARVLLKHQYNLTGDYYVFKLHRRSVHGALNLTMTCHKKLKKQLPANVYLLCSTTHVLSLAVKTKRYRHYINTSSTVMYCVALEKTGKDYVSCDYPITIFFSFSYSETLLRYVF